MAHKIESISLQRFLRQFVAVVDKAYRGKLPYEKRNYMRDQIRAGFPVKIKRKISGVSFTLEYCGTLFGEHNWSMHSKEWSIKCNTQFFHVTNDHEAFYRDMTMLMLMGFDNIRLEL